jgi:hypothetical protein
MTFTSRPRAAVVGLYACAWLFAIYGRGALPSLHDPSAEAISMILVGIAHVAVGALINRWWACVLAIVPPLVALPDRDDWLLLSLYTPPAALLIAFGVLGARALCQRRRV